MSNFPRAATALLACVTALAGNMRADTGRGPAAPACNPDMLSSGVFLARDAAGGANMRLLVPRARVGAPDLSKGRPPVILDPRVGANIRLNDDPPGLLDTQRGQAEPHIIRSVVAPELLLATFQEGRYFDAGSLDCGYSVSRDGGFTWTRALIPNLTATSGGRFNRATDPVAGAGPQGDLYLQALGSVSGAFTIAAVVVSRSTDNGATWSGPFTVFQPPDALTMPDKNWLAVNDYPDAPNSGRLVCTWTNFLTNAAGGSLGNPIVASYSDNRGATWSTPIDITRAPSQNQGTQPVFLPDGSLAVVYITFVNPNNVSQFDIRCKLSTDGGRTFPDTSTTVVPLVAGWDDPDVRDGVFLPAATAARQSGALFITYTAVVANTPRVLVTKSTNRGTTWSAPIVVSDNPAGMSVMNPAISVSPDGRTVAVVFMDKRNAPDARNFVDHYAALSFDGGVTWQPNVRLSSLSSDIRYAAQTSRGAMLGDYLGVAPSLAADQPCVAVWCDTRTGDADPFTTRFTAVPAGNYQAWRVAHYTPDELRNPAVSGPATGAGGSAANLFYYDTGLDPRAPVSGETLVLNRPAPATLDVAWLARTDSTVQSTIAYTAAGTAPTAQLNAGVAPSSPAPSGLTWRTARITNAPLGLSRISRSLTLADDPSGTVRGAAPDQAANATDSRLINVSTRARSGTGGDQMIVGFVVDGGVKTVLVRAAGPALGALGVAGTLPDPRLELIFGSQGQLQVFSATNDNWGTSPGVDAALFTRVGAFPFAAGSKDAALLQSLAARPYTAIVSDATNTSGIALVEAYDADPLLGEPTAARFANLSTRGRVGAGDDALIAGFVLKGNQPRRVLLRAVGPSLASFSVDNALPDPVLTVFQGSAALVRNDDWEISASSGAIAATAQRVGAFALNAASLDAALLITLAPGNYTAVVTSADGSTGVALIEVYDAD